VVDAISNTTNNGSRGFTNPAGHCIIIIIVIINKPDIITRDNEKGTCMLIDIAISGDRNVIKKRSREDSKI